MSGEMLVQFVSRHRNNNNGKKIGALVAVGPNKIGWSLCKKEDEFSKNEGINIALERAQNCKPGDVLKCPRSLQRKVMKMMVRTTQYYKNAEKIEKAEKNSKKK